MEKALILGKLSIRAPRNIIEEIKKLQGVTDTDLIFGPYDFYVIFETETKEMMGDIALKIRSIEGVLDSLTCYVVSFSDIRPEARGPGIE
jgi:nitrate reductase NapAB chaperone NapD